jgi:predicted transcriptional regulator
MLNCERMSKLLPAIRREFSILLYKKGMKKKEIAEMLNITQSAVSQYLKMKRGKIQDKHVYKLIKDIITKENKNQKLNVCCICKKINKNPCYCE